MKKLLAILSAASLLLALAACSSSKTTTDTEAAAESTASAESASAESAEVVGMANPNRYDVGKEEMGKVTGISLDAPEEAENVKYNIIDAEGEHPMAEVTFTMNGKEYGYRAQSTELLSLTKDTLEYANISGIYTDWTTKTSVTVNNRSGMLLSDGNNTVVIWLDVVPGILYNLSFNGSLDDMSEEEITALAENLFEPMQDDAVADSYDLTGVWTEEHEDGETYCVLTLKEDGSGTLETMPDNVSGLPLDYEVNGTAITAHMGSADDNTSMEYLPDSDQISYDGDLYSRSAS